MNMIRAQPYSDLKKNIVGQWEHGWQVCWDIGGFCLLVMDFCLLVCLGFLVLHFVFWFWGFPPICSIFPHAILPLPASPSPPNLKVNKCGTTNEEMLISEPGLPLGRFLWLRIHHLSVENSNNSWFYQSLFLSLLVKIVIISVSYRLSVLVKPTCNLYPQNNNFFSIYGFYWSKMWQFYH